MTRNSRLIAQPIAWMLVLVAGACSRTRGNQREEERSTGTAPQGTAAATSADLQRDLASAATSSTGRPDPCVLVSHEEAEKYLGPLAHDPYRTTDAGAPDRDGEVCFYRAADGRSIRVVPSFKDGKAEMKILAMTAGLMSQVFTDESGKADTLEGGWDEARWMAPGHLYVLKGDASIETDVSASRAGPVGAAFLAARAIERLGRPLNYDGAAATQGAPVSRETGDACALVSRADAEAILGRLDGDPVPDGRGENTSCTYHVRTKFGTTDVRLAVTWHNGFL